MKPTNRTKRKNLVDFLKETGKKSEEHFNTIPVVSTKASSQPQDASVDQKIDKYLIQYEREAIPQSAMFGGLAQPAQVQTPPAIARLQENKNGLSKKAVKNLMTYIFEADDLEMDAAGGDDAGGGLDLGGDNTEPSGEGGDVEQAPEQESPVLNVQKFASNMARLVNNYDVMLDPKTAILNRAYVFLSENYNAETAKEFLIVMKKYYQLTPNSRSTNAGQSGSDYYSAVGNVGDGNASLPSGGGLGGGGEGGV
jgi:hypothetical protein